MPRDIRHARIDKLDAALDAAIAVPGKRAPLATELFVGGPPGDWPAPTLSQCERASAQARAAADAARDELRTRGITHFETTFRALPRLPVEWQRLRLEQALPPAPLVHSLIHADVVYEVARLANIVYARSTAHLWHTQNRQKLMRCLNVFAQLELLLWQYATQAGHSEPPPYAVRYDLARWLWDPCISGALFCLRCGDELHYKRSARTSSLDNPAEPQQPRTARCRRCSRGRPDHWPQHALEPHRRGTWLLHCTFPGCAELFVGRRHARHCHKHRLNALTRSRRRPPA